MVSGQLIRREFRLSRANFHQYRGVARIFQRGGHRGYSPDHHPWITDYIWLIPLLSLVYQRAQSYYRGMKAKQVSFSTMAFNAKILSWRFRHLNIVGCLLQRRPNKGGGGGGGVTGTPPSYAPAIDAILIDIPKGSFCINFD